MKAIPVMAATLLAAALLPSCSDYDSIYGYSGHYSSGGNYHSTSIAYSTAYAPLGVGFISTSYDRWCWDPYRHCYYDRSLRRYYNHVSYTYYSSPPRKHRSVSYPEGYRSGVRLPCPSYLPRDRHPSQVGHGNHSRPSDSKQSNRHTFVASDRKTESSKKMTPVISNQSIDRSAVLRQTSPTQAPKPAVRSLQAPSLRGSIKQSSVVQPSLSKQIQKAPSPARDLTRSRATNQSVESLSQRFSSPKSSTPSQSSTSTQTTRTRSVESLANRFSSSRTSSPSRSTSRSSVQNRERTSRHQIR